MNNPFAIAARFTKTADPVTDQAINDIRQMALLSLGAGAATRGAVGLYNTVKHTLSPHKPKYPGAIMAPMPYPVRDDGSEKVADGDPSLWKTPAMVGTGMLGVYGGWKALDALLESRRKSEEQEELDNARQGFESALVQTGRPRPMKLAGDADPALELSALLDGLFDSLATKQADWTDRLKQMGGMYLGGYAVPAAAITAMMAYNTASKNNQADVTAKAMDRRVRRSYASRPSEVLTVPQAVPVEPEVLDDPPAEM